MTACEACKTIPPVVVKGYVGKGEWVEVGGLKTYVTGSSSATKAIVDIYDIFGFAPQIIQGADALAAALGAVVFIPDLLEGNYAKGEWFAPTLSPEQQAAKDAAFKIAFAFDNFIAPLNDFVGEAGKKWGSVKTWAALGLCWGGKVAVLASVEGSVFKVSGQVHPGKLDAEDAKKTTVPHIILASKGEDAAEVQKCKEVLEGEGKPGVVETYGTQQHGWMGARANFEDEKNLQEYTRGYNQIATFFAKYL